MRSPSTHLSIPSTLNPQESSRHAVPKNSDLVLLQVPPFLYHQINPPCHAQPLSTSPGPLSHIQDNNYLSLSPVSRKEKAHCAITVADDPLMISVPPYKPYSPPWHYPLLSRRAWIHLRPTQPQTPFRKPLASQTPQSEQPPMICSSTGNFSLAHGKSYVQTSYEIPVKAHLSSSEKKTPMVTSPNFPFAMPLAATACSL